MRGKNQDLGSFIKNPPSIFEIIGEEIGTQYPKLQAYLKKFHNEVLPQLKDLGEILERAQNRIEDTHKIEKNKQIQIEIEKLEKEYLWAQYIEFEAQQRAIMDLIQKLGSEISVNQSNLDKINMNLSALQGQYQQKNDSVQTEFKKFRTINADLQQLFKDQNQILRKINQIETQLNNPKAKNTPDENSNLEKELEELRIKEKETREKLPQKQKELESQRLLHQQKEKEFRPIKINFEGTVTEKAKMDQLNAGDHSRLEEKRKELDELSAKIQGFSKSNNINLQNRPPTIRTKNIIEDKIKSIKANLLPNTGSPSDAQSTLIDNNDLLPPFYTLSDILETIQTNEIKDEIRSFSKDIATLRNQFAPKFSQLMDGMNKKGGVQVQSLLTGNGTLRFCESGKNNSIVSLVSILLSISGAKTSQIRFNTRNLSSKQIEELKEIIKVVQSQTDLEIIIVEE